MTDDEIKTLCEIRDKYCHWGEVAVMDKTINLLKSRDCSDIIAPYISNDINCPCNIKKCTSETIESCCGCPEWFKWKYDIEQSDKHNPRQAYVGKHLKRI